MKHLTTTSLALVLALTLISCSGGSSQFSGLVPSGDGVPIHYEMKGEGEPVLVFVHGWSCDATYWQDQFDHFAETHKVVAIDLAGHGDSGQLREQYTMETFGADVAAVLEEQRLRNAVLIGHSMGGAVIVEAALAVPERVIGLIGIDNFEDVGTQYPAEQIAAFVEAFETDFKGTTIPWVRSMFPGSADSSLAIAVAEDMASAPPAVAVSAMREYLDWYTQKTSARLELLAVPLMCVNADANPTDAEAIKKIVPGYQLKVVEGTGHFLMREKPEEFNAALARLIARFGEN